MAEHMLEDYNPENPVDPNQWLALDEDERAGLITDYVEENETSVGPSLLHAHIHLAIENQIALGNETPVAETMERLVAEGLSRHDAIHAVGTCLASLFAGGSGGEQISQDSYFDAVRKLTAQSWLSMMEEE